MKELKKKIEEILIKVYCQDYGATEATEKYIMPLFEKEWERREKGLKLEKRQVVFLQVEGDENNFWELLKTGLKNYGYNQAIDDLNQKLKESEGK